MRVVRCVVLMTCCLALAGCSLFGRKPAASPPAPAPAAAAPAPASAPVQPVAGVPGLLAGQILDNYSRRPGAAYIQVSLVREGSEPQAAPIEVAADGQGYFTIQGLQAGKHYQLLARFQDGDRKLAGSIYATPPNPRLVIRISEGNVTPGTPDVPAPPWPSPGPQPPAPVWPDDKGPPNTGDPKRPAGLGMPVKTDDPAPPTAPPVRPDRVISINPQVPSTPPAGEKPPESPAPSLTPDVPAPVPSCALTGNTLANFALYDLSGQPWEFRQHRARLTLLDFWGTWCTGCLHALPHLKILQERYANYGLQVVGIAYEDGPLPEQVQKVDRIRKRYSITYQLLLGGESKTCPVRQQFDVRAFPTLVLVDETGRILWRGQGLDPQKLNELEMLIRQKLGVR